MLKRNEQIPVTRVNVENGSSKKLFYIERIDENGEECGIVDDSLLTRQTGR